MRPWYCRGGVGVGVYYGGPIDTYLYLYKGKESLPPPPTLPSPGLTMESVALIKSINPSFQTSIHLVCSFIHCMMPSCSLIMQPFPKFRVCRIAWFPLHTQTHQCEFYMDTYIICYIMVVGVRWLLKGELHVWWHCYSMLVFFTHHFKWIRMYNGAWNHTCWYNITYKLTLTCMYVCINMELAQ